MRKPVPARIRLFILIIFFHPPLIYGTNDLLI